MRRARLFAYLVRDYGPSRITPILRYRMGGETRSLGFVRDLRQPFDAPQARISISVRASDDGDLDALFGAASGAHQFSTEEKTRRYRRMATARVPGCYVAVTDDGRPCYMQWLLTQSENARLRFALGPIYPWLDAQTVLLEGAYTPEHMRGLRIMPAAMANIAERGRDHGARWVITFIGEDNEASIKGARRAGFEPYVRRIERWSRLRRAVTWEPLETDVDSAGWDGLPGSLPRFSANERREGGEPIG